MESFLFCPLVGDIMMRATQGVVAVNVLENRGVRHEKAFVQQTLACCRAATLMDLTRGPYCRTRRHHTPKSSVKDGFFVVHICDPLKNGKVVAYVKS